jgi:hypothetical protein
MFYKLPPWQRHIIDNQAECCFIIITLKLKVFSMRRWRIFVVRAIALGTSECEAAELARQLVNAES